MKTLKHILDIYNHVNPIHSEAFQIKKKKRLSDGYMNVFTGLYTLRFMHYVTSI